MENDYGSTKAKLIFPGLSFEIIGASLSVFNENGWGFSEKHYQKALAKELSELGLNYQREVFIPFSYKNSTFCYFADFIVEDKILLELKVVQRLGYTQVRQILDYLIIANLKLGIIIYFTPEGVKYRRVLNPRVKTKEK